MQSIRLLILVIFLSGCTTVPDGIAPVNGFDAEKYLGIWYEVARFDHSFERGLQQVTATYSRREDGGIRVLNKGFNPEKGTWKEAEGKAYFVGEETTGHLKVSFFGPFYASYVVFDLDKNNYSYSLVTGPNRDYLWVLSRQPIIKDKDYEMLLAKAEQLGFDVNRLIKVQH